MNRAYSILDIKAATTEGGKRVFSGVATTPSVDRGGDVVEPKGAEFQLPVPLLWQHDARAPIGWITDAKVTDAGIEVRGEIATMDEPGKLKDRLDEAWQSIGSKLVRGLSIGFKPLESARIGDSYAYRYLKWLWLELSAVTIPMNGDCSITAIKSADQAYRRAAPGARPVIRLDPAGGAGTPKPGDSGSDLRRKGVVYLK
jgi:HK97 family phage prohead protease